MKSVMIVGVGGQGTLLASRVLGRVMLDAGYDVKVSEVHGMSQRGGSVSTHVRYGEKVASPVVPEGCADVLVAFEKAEAARWLHYLKKDGALVVNDFEIYSLPVLTGAAEYPEGIIERLKEKVQKIKCVDAARLAEELGNIRAQNVVLLGALVKALGLEGPDWKSVIKETVPAKLLDLNLKAFDAGLSQ